MYFEVYFVIGGYHGYSPPGTCWHERSHGGSGAVVQTSVGSLWLLLSSMLANESGGEATPGSLVRGARKHLEAGHAAYMLDVIRKHAQVRAGAPDVCRRRRLQRRESRQNWRIVH